MTTRAINKAVPFAVLLAYVEYWRHDLIFDVAENRIVPIEEFRERKDDRMFDSNVNGYIVYEAHTMNRAYILGYREDAENGVH